MSQEDRNLRQLPTQFFKLARLAVLALAVSASPLFATQQTRQKTFGSAAEACHALVRAVESDDQSALLSILGPDAKDLISSGDPAQDKSSQEEFIKKYKEMHRLVNEPDGTTTLYIGAENWPTPIPLLHKGTAWYFDTPAGKKEILYRRIGKNELAVIQVCQELVDAQKEYYSQAHDGESQPQYAGKLSSDPGKHNGLYWETSAGQPESPIGPLIAAAAADPGNPDQKPQPFMGYYFRILTGQKTAKGSHSYIVDGKMTGGFAFLAYPAEYRSSGVMTFMVDKDGVVYEKDLGPRTAAIAKTLTRYSRDASWRQAD
ncbi:MAG: DUF2950 domain-containing protein [Candidatus Sulfotelmatobacter sp.]